MLSHSHCDNMGQARQCAFACLVATLPRTALASPLSLQAAPWGFCFLPCADPCAASHVANAGAYLADTAAEQALDGSSQQHSNSKEQQGCTVSNSSTCTAQQLFQGTAVAAQHSNPSCSPLANSQQALSSSVSSSNTRGGRKPDPACTR
jgi:hypothetical protein